MSAGTRIAVSAAMLALMIGTAHAQISIKTKTVGTVTNGKPNIDYKNAKPKTLPIVKSKPLSLRDLLADGAAATFPGVPGYEKGGAGNGKLSPKTIPFSKALTDEDGPVTRHEYGVNNHPYTTSVVDNSASSYNRMSGKLFFNDNGFSFVCSASLIKTGIVVTAAHCVSAFGERRFHDSFQFVPAYNKGSAPFGVWTSAHVRVLASYFDGTDSCAVAGVVCENDVAVIALKPQNGSYPGVQTGWYGYGYNGFGFVNGQTAITQIGYPVALNGGQEQIRTDSLGVTSASNANNTVIGSLQTGGSSGGPWLINFGQPPRLTSPTGFGAARTRNVVVGTTSWGYTDTTSSGPKEQGASRFTSANIDALVTEECLAYPAACSRSVTLQSLDD
ncbi:trypsin-like serine protease [Methylopila sp. M107]|uniref:trypsin-like serine peptidase n=1 Tax=Methylopila sp. M107 TaxID=1101190 RepID=UPI00039D8AA9|nr:trypsin-like serine protease [Methylopila sp. M107]